MITLLTLVAAILPWLLLILLIAFWLPFRSSIRFAAVPWIIVWIFLGIIGSYFSKQITFEFNSWAAQSFSPNITSIAVSFLVTSSASPLVLGLMICSNAAYLIDASPAEPRIVTILRRLHTHQNKLGVGLICLKLAPTMTSIIIVLSTHLNKNA
jgi:hypothetical protein